MKICKNCRAQLEDNAVFCGECGSRCEEPVYAVPQKATGKASSATLIAIIAAITVIIVSAMLIFGTDFFSKTETEKESEPEEVTEEEAVTEEETIPQPPEKTAAPPIPKQSTYMVYKSDAGWETANNNANYYGGHLVSINSADEFRKVCNLAYNNGIKVFWVGAKRGYSQAWSNVRWNDGSYMDFTQWYTTEPSYRSEGVEECYLMVFYVNGTWYYNDAPESVSQYYSGRMGYIVEYEG